jgi:hypothetical protein
MILLENDHGVEQLLIGVVIAPLVTVIVWAYKAKVKETSRLRRDNKKLTALLLKHKIEITDEEADSYLETEVNPTND